MAEAVFTITADIAPQIDERELQRQGQALANQLNGLLSKSVNKVSVAPPAGSFRPFQQEIEKTRGIFDKFQDSVSTIPRSLSNIARQGRSAFLRFTDAVNITRREVVGFGQGIRETIRNTNLFEDALDGIRAAGGTIADLPTRFEDLAAQIQSGTSVIDRMAESGNQLAQIFQPIQQQGEAARTEFVELNRSIDVLTGVVSRLAGASQRTGSIIEEQFGLSPFEQQIKDAEELLKLLPEGSRAFIKLQGSINEAFRKGTTDALIQELLQAKDAAQELTGPLGRIAQFINERSGGRFFADVTAEARETAIALEQGVIGQIRRLGGGDLLGPLENFNARLRSVRDGVASLVRGFEDFRTGLARILPGRSPIGILVDSLSRSITDFTRFKAEGLDAFQAVGRIATQTFQKIKDDTGFSSFIQRIKSELVGIGLQIQGTDLGNKFFQSLGPIKEFLNKNLIDPLKAAGPQVKEAFSRIGQDAASGLGLGVDKGKSSVAQKAREMGQTFLNALKRIMRSSSPSKATEEEANNAVKGFTNGISNGLGSIAASAATFAKSFTSVLGVSLAGLGAVALNTGKDFNILKQIINSSLPVIVGSEKAAAGLLEQVNALNDSSPFARSTFLELTRVLAGFGVTVEKVTPLIDAIQQTVAATGGSDQDILELGNAFARLQSQGRVSLDVLQSFTTRGVDAVAILADGFGKTTSEMRKMISEGLVPANKAIDILTKGLKDRFDGATDAVARNFPGALQRVQARLRDIGGTLLTAFITPTGGGALVTFLNNMADILSHINKNILPAFAPLLQKVADALVTVSEKAENFVTRLSGEQVSAFIEKAKPLLPLLAALAALIPGAFGFIPVIGPLIAGLGGPFTALAAAIGVLLAQSGQLGTVMDGISNTLSQVGQSAGTAFGFLKDNAVGAIAVLGGGIGLVQGFVGAISGVVTGITRGIPILSTFGSIFGKIGTLVQKFLGIFSSLSSGITALLPATGKLAGVFKLISGPVGIAISIFTQLVLTSQRFRESLGRLFEAVKPVAQLIGSVFAVAIKVLDEAIKALEPVFTATVNILASVFEAFRPVVDKVQEFIGFLQKHEVIEKFFAGVKAAIEGVITVINGFIDVLDKALGPFINLPEIKVNVDVDPAKKAAEEAAKQFKELQKAGEESAAAIEDNYKAATKAVELAEKAASDAKDQLLQAIQSAKGVIDGLISSFKNMEAANKAVEAAREKAAEATANVTQLEKDYARALEDAISPANELAVAERNLTRIRKGLTDLNREEISLGKENVKLRQEIADLEGEEAAEDRAALARAEERAQINLNKAKQAEIDLLNELNGTEKISLNLAGLSLDQIRAKLAAARAQAKAKKGEREQTKQEIEDSKRLARLDVEDATAAVEDAKEARENFEIDRLEQINENKEKIRDNEERIKEIADDRADQLLDEEEALKRINRLREGETTQQGIILSFDKQISTAKKEAQTAAEAIATATTNAKIAQEQFRLDTATAKGDADGILTAQTSLWELQSGKLLGTNQVLRGILAEQKSNIEGARDAARQMNDELVKANKLQGAATSLQAFGSALVSAETRSERIFRQAGEGGVTPAQLKSVSKEEIRKQLEPSLRAALSSGAALDQDNNPVFFNNATINNIINEALSKPTSELRKTLQEIFKRLGVQVPGFSTGYAPGDLVHSGLNNGVGIARMFEYGREAVLPLTRPFDLSRVVRNPAVLPKILDALPRWSRPDNPLSETGISSDITNIVRSARTSGGPANADVYEKKSQREFASTIGDAVKVAVKEALAESDSFGNDIDINVAPDATERERAIAREVKRQVNKALGKW